MRCSIIYFVIAIFASCQSKKEKGFEPAHPKVKLVLESIHDPVGIQESFEYNPDVSEDTNMTELQFNGKGQLIRESKFDANGNLKSNTTFKYDKHGNNVQMEVRSSNGLLVSKTTSRFDSKRKLIERNEVDVRDQVLRRQRLEHSKDGTKWMVTYKKTNGKLTKILECVFDEKGYNILNNYYTREALRKKDIVTYSPNGDPIQDVNLSSTGSIQFVENHEGIGNSMNDPTLKTSEKHEYDDNGNRIATIQYFPLTNKHITTRYKHGKNKLETATLLSNKIISSKQIVHYNDKQHVVETFRYGLGGRLEEHQRHLYEYDLAGNWTKHKTIINNKSISMTIRQMEYF